MTVGQRIAAYRKKKGYSQEDLAAMMNVTRQSVSRWESDATLPDIDRLITLSTLLGISLEEMLGMEKDAQEGNREGLSEEQLVRVLSEYNEESREKTKKGIRKAALICGFLAASLVQIMYVRLKVNNEETERIMTQRLDTIENNMSLMQMEFESQIKASSWPENLVMSEYELKYVSGDYEKGSAVVSLDGQLSVSTSAVSFYAMDKEGNRYLSKDCVFESSSGRIRGTVEVPVKDRLTWQIRTDDQTVSLHKGESCIYYLKSLSNIQMNMELTYDGEMGDGARSIQLYVPVYSQTPFLQEDAEIMADVYADGIKKDTVTLAYSEEFTEGRRKQDLIDQGEEYEGSSYVFTGSYTLPGKGKYLFVPRAKLKDGRTGEPYYSMQYSWDEKYGWVFEQIFSD